MTNFCCPGELIAAYAAAADEAAAYAAEAAADDALDARGIMYD